jgi:protein TonB
MKASAVFLIKCSRRLFLVPLLATAACKQVNYADRARTPLRPMVSVVHKESDSFDTPPRVLEGYRPDYPEPEGEHREKGFVSVICTIGVDGKATDFEVESMTSPAFLVEAVKAISKWKWAPAMKDGHPVKQKVRVPMHFNAI